jgi:hypothetical protein
VREKPHAGTVTGTFKGVIVMGVRIIKSGVASSLAAAFAAGDAGAKLAADHANAETPGWSEVAESYARQFVATRTKPFIAATLRIYAENNGCPSPPDKRAWGCIIQTLRRDKTIVPTGVWVPSPYQHGRHVPELRRG